MPLLTRSGPRGFTLIELMITVVVIGILVAIAYPAYTSQVQRSRRADAVALLSVVAQAQERYRTNQSTYGSTLSAIGVDASTITRHYAVTIDGIGNPASFRTGYIATAKTISTSPQRFDTQCASISIRLDGADLQHVAADSADVDTSSYCWAR